MRTTLAEGILPVLAAAVVSGIAVRWVLPPVFVGLAKLVRMVVSLLAGIAILPEFMVSRAHRERAANPPLAAYQYSDLVCWLAKQAHSCIGFILRQCASMSRGVPIMLVFIVAAIVMAGWVLN
jgi:hypothetical protein